MKFCSQCGAAVALQIPEGDNRERFVCESCQFIHYQNPNVVVGTVPLYHCETHGLRVLLCRRDIEPRHGYWTLPAGFLENDETTEQGAIRETVEESCANIDDLKIYRIFNVPHTNQIHMFFRARMLDDAFSTTPESSEVRLFSFDEVPWTELAFPPVHSVVEDFIAEHPSGDFGVEMIDIDDSYWRRMFKPKDKQG